MSKTQSYTVAGHTFRLTMTENENAWQGIPLAYAPFEELRECPALFTLTVSEALPSDDAQLILNKQLVDKLFGFSKSGKLNIAPNEKSKGRFVP